MDVAQSMPGQRAPGRGARAGGAPGGASTAQAIPAPRDPVRGASAPVLEAVGLVADVPGRPSGPLRRRGAPARIVDGIDLVVRRGELVVLVGGSRDGRGALARLLTGGLAPSVGVVSLLHGDVATPLRSEDASAVLLPVDPAARLPRRRTVREMLLGGAGQPQATAARVLLVDEVLELFGVAPEVLDLRADRLGPEARHAVLVARALLPRPSLIVHDTDREPEAEVLHHRIAQLMARLRLREGVACVVLVAEMADAEQGADRVAVLHEGRVVEVGSPGELRGRALHPLTQELLAAMPDAAWGGSAIDAQQWPASVDGDAGVGWTGMASGPESGCSFRNRCVAAQDVCLRERPELARPLGASHLVACHFPRRLGQRAPAAVDLVLKRTEPTSREFARD